MNIVDTPPSMGLLKLLCVNFETQMVYPVFILEALNRLNFKEVFKGGGCTPLCVLCISLKKSVSALKTAAFENGVQ